jgi:sugar phosphate isomerase/epimerase
MNRQIGAQYFTIRKQITDIDSFDVACKKVADIGYKIVQISGVSLEAKEMREVLDKYGLKCVVTHRKFDEFQNNIEEVIDYNKTLGCDFCGVGITPLEYAVSTETVDDYIKEINKICEVLKAEHMYYGCHNHTMEYAKFDGKTIMDRFLEETDPEVFKFIADTHWLQMSGKVPQEEIKRLGSRAKIVHFKDLGIDAQEWKKPVMKEVGQGNLDWDAIIAACDDSGVEYAIVEQDKNHVDDDPFKALQMSYEFLKTKGFN